MASKRLVLDANILIRAVLGVRVRSLIEAHCERVAFFVAEASLLECPIWTEDRDFFGSGVPTWTTATVERFLREP